MHIVLYEISSLIGTLCPEVLKHSLVKGRKKTIGPEHKFSNVVETEQYIK